MRQFLLAVALLLGLVSPIEASATIALVNTASGVDNTGAADPTIATGAFNQSGGNLTFVAASAVQSGGQTWPPTITDTAGDTFTLINTGSYDGNNNVSCWYAKNTVANASNVVTATFSGTWTFAAIASAQYSGVDRTSPLDTSATGSGNGNTATSVTSGSFTTTQANEVLVAAGRVLFNNNQTFTAGTGYTIEVNDSAAQIAIEDQIVSSTQSGVTASMSYSAAVGWEMCVATFKQAAARHATMLTTGVVGQPASAAPAGRQFLEAIFTAGNQGNVGNANVHTWLGYSPDNVSDYQNPNGAIGAAFFWQQQGINFPFESPIYPGAGESSSSVADYQNTASGANDNAIVSTLSSLGAGPNPAPVIYVFDIDREWAFNQNAFTAGVTTVTTAWKHIFSKARAQFPGVKICIAVIADASYFGEQPFLDALANGDVDCLAMDIYFHTNRFTNPAGSVCTNQACQQAAWTAVYGFASPTGPTAGAPQGTGAFWIKYANDRGWSVMLGEWADDGPTTGAGASLCMHNMAAVIKNTANHIVYHDYWSNSFLENASNELLTGSKQAAFVQEFGVAAVGANYVGTFFPSWAAPTGAQVTAVEAKVPY